MAGAGLLAVGIWVTVNSSSFLGLLGPFSQNALQFVNVGFFCIAIGAVLVLLGFLGCCGAHKESRCLLIMFFSIILIIFIAEVAAGVVALAYSSFAESILKGWAMPALKDQYGNDPVITKLWNATMIELNCCGFSNYGDFNNSYYYTHNNQSYPPSCCFSFSPCIQEYAEISDVQGCFQQILSDIKNNAIIVGGVAAGICGVEVAAMIVSMYLYCYLDKKMSS
ncbi:tetraspanin-1 isoform X2 [Denticeps clupeoides]|nr:tetraspanin-1 isoform X2 [Denticeps clupeoides]